MASCHIDMGPWIQEADSGLCFMAKPALVSGDPRGQPFRCVVAAGTVESKGHICLSLTQARYQGSGQALWMPLTPRLLFWGLIAVSLDLVWGLRIHPPFPSFGNPASLITH